MADSLAMATHEQLSAHDVFVGDEDFYKLLEDPGEQPEARPAVASAQSAVDVIRRRRLSSVQRMLVISIVLVASLLVYVLVKPRLGGTAAPPSSTVKESTSDSQQVPASDPTVAESAQAKTVQIHEQQPPVSPAEPAGPGGSH